MSTKLCRYISTILISITFMACKAYSETKTYDDGTTEIHTEKSTIKKFHSSHKHCDLIYDSLGCLISKEITFYDNSQDWSAYGMPIIQTKTYTYINGSLHEKIVETNFWLWRKRNTKRGFHTLKN